jgi:glycosyltransferase involved in cell wall biosynthesis
VNFCFLYNELSEDILTKGSLQFTGALSVDAHLDVALHGLIRHGKRAKIFIIDRRDLSVVYALEKGKIFRINEEQKTSLRFDYAFISPYAIHSIDDLLARYNIATSVFSIPAIWWYEHPDIYPFRLLEKILDDLNRKNTCYIVTNDRINDYFVRFAMLFTGKDISERVITLPYFVREFFESEPSKDEKIIIDSGGPWRWTANHIFAKAFVDYCNENPSTKLKVVFSLKDESNPDHEEYQRQLKDIYAKLKEPSHVDMLPWSDKTALRNYLSAAHYGLSINLNTIEGYLSSRVRLRDYVAYQIPIISTTENIFYPENKDICLAVEPDYNSFYTLLSQIDVVKTPRQRANFNIETYNAKYAAAVQTMVAKLRSVPVGSSKLAKSDIRITVDTLMQGHNAYDAAALLRNVTYQLSRKHFVEYMKRVVNDPRLGDMIAQDPQLKDQLAKLLNLRPAESALLSDADNADDVKPDLSNTLCLFQLETVEATTLVHGERPSTRFSQDINLFYLAQEALRLGARVAFHQKNADHIIEVKSVFPTLNVVAQYDFGRVSAESVAVFSVYPADFPFYSQSLPKTVPSRGVLLIPAIHWIEAPERYYREFIDQLRESLIYDIDDAICQNEQMLEMFQSMAILVGGEFDKGRIHVAPCGYVPEDEGALNALRQSRDEIRREMKLKPEDIAVINAGGVWKWTDLDTFLEAFIELHRTHPGNPLKFFVMGLRQNSNSDHAEFIDQFGETIRNNQDLVDSGAINVIWDWEEASHRLPRFNYGADLGVNVSKPSIENAQSFRQRFVEYMKAGLPVINTQGDPMSQTEFRTAMMHVESGNKDSYVEVFREILGNAEMLYNLREKAFALRGTLRTDRVYGPMLEELLGTPPVSKTKRQALVDWYSGYGSFAEIKARRGNVLIENSDLSAPLLAPPASGPTVGETVVALGYTAEERHDPAPDMQVHDTQAFEESSEVHAVAEEQPEAPRPGAVDLNEVLELQGDAFVNRLYEVLLSRAPDPNGLNHYVKRLANGEKNTTILYEIAMSKEGKWHRYFGDLHDQPDVAFIDEVYRRVIHREPDWGGKAHYLRLMEKKVDRHEIVQSIRLSAEARRIEHDVHNAVEVFINDYNRRRRWWRWSQSIRKRLRRLTR